MYTHNCTLSIVWIHSNGKACRKKPFKPKIVRNVSRCYGYIRYIYHIIVWTKSHGVCCKQLRCRWTKREQTNQRASESERTDEKEIWIIEMTHIKTLCECVSCCRLPLFVYRARRINRPASQPAIFKRFSLHIRFLFVSLTLVPSIHTHTVT